MLHILKIKLVEMGGCLSTKQKTPLKAEIGAVGAY